MPHLFVPRYIAQFIYYVKRALAHAAVSDDDKLRLRAMLAEADPVLLLAGVRAAQMEMGKRVDERGMVAGRAETPAPLDLALLRRA